MTTTPLGVVPVATFPAIVQDAGYSEPAGTASARGTEKAKALSIAITNPRTTPSTNARNGTE